jgi:hypothetical protein
MFSGGMRLPVKARVCAALRTFAQLIAAWGQKSFFVGKEKRGRLAGTLAPGLEGSCRLFSPFFGFFRLSVGRFFSEGPIRGKDAEKRRASGGVSTGRFWRKT